MSTRRARIKNITSLPVRRKATESTEKKNDKSDIPESSSQEETSQNKDETLAIKDKIKRPATPKQILDKCSSPRGLILKGTPNKRKLSPVIRTISPKYSPLIQKLIASPYRAKITPGKPIIVELESEITKLPSPVIKRPRTENTSNVMVIKESIVENNTEKTDDSVIKKTLTTEQDILDGIVPLQSSNVPKPIDLLKNQLISDNAEVSFDPILPLPSLSKVRPKLRPAPRLPARRNSVQGSASESEDDNRRSHIAGGGTPAPPSRKIDPHTPHAVQNPLLFKELSRVRTESLSSTGTQGTVNSQAVPGSPMRDKQLVKSRRSEMSRRMSALRRRQRIKDYVNHKELTMYDLIFYNPTSNPIVPEDKLESELTKPVEVSDKEEADPDDPPAEEDAAPVPQIKLGPNGEIVIDEQSLVIKQTQEARGVSSSVLIESSSSNKGRYSRQKRACDWSDDETVRFYRALASVGTDFSLMGPLFPTRSRRELKSKFKKEERMNGAQVDKALRSQTHWDGQRLQEEFEQERRLAEEKKEKERLAFIEQKKAEKRRQILLKEEMMRDSLSTQAIETKVTRGVKSTRGKSNKARYATMKAGPAPLTADDVIEKATIEREKQIQEFATLTKIRNLTPPQNVLPFNSGQIPNNIEAGSLVVLTVDDPKSPSKKMLQTYISHAAGQLIPVSLPPHLLNSVVGYMQKSSRSDTSSPQVSSVGSPGSVASSVDSRRSVTPGQSQRSRHSSFSITQL